MISEADQQKIVDLAERRLNSGQVAQRLGLRRSRVHNFMATHGLHAARQRAVACMRNGKPLRSFSPEEDVWIEALRVQGYTCEKIGALCGKRFGHPRTAATISIRLRMLASRDVARADG